MRWRDVSEIVFGMILQEKISPDYVNPEAFFPPYGEAIKLVKAGSDISELYDKIGLAPIKAALEAEQVIGDKTPTDFIKLLDTAYSREELAKVLEYEVNKLHKGLDADLLRIEGAMSKHVNLEHKYMTLDKIDPETVIWKQTGYQPIDEYVGGIPDSNLTIIAAPPGVGKTSLLLKMALSTAHLKKRVLIYTFEMTSGQVKRRTMDLMNTKPEIEQYVKICDDILDVDEVFAEASRLAAVEDLGFIGIDFADLMLTAAEEEGNVALLYRTMANLAKKSRTPVVLLSQLSRRYTERGGEPRIHDIRWSGLAEAMAALILLIYNPNQIAGASARRDTQLPVQTGRAYLIVGKSRFGFKQGTIGAINVPWDGALAWGDKAVGWVSLTSI